MALYIHHSIFHFPRLLYVRPETFGPYYVGPMLSEFISTSYVQCCVLVFLLYGGSFWLEIFGKLTLTRLLEFTRIIRIVKG